MMILNFNDALASIGQKASDVQFPEFDLSIKPTDNLRAPIGSCKVEGLILARTESVLFE